MVTALYYEMTSLVWLITVGLFTLTKADKPTYPYAANQTCPGKAWLAETSGFRFSEAPNAPLHPERTFTDAYYFPYIVRLQERLAGGQSIYFKGRIEDDANRVTFNLLSQTTTTEDMSVGAVVLHMSLRYFENDMVLNSAENGNWGDEIKIGIPFPAGQPFTMQIIIKDSYFEFYFNGKRATTFKHRMSYDIVDYFHVGGEIELDELRVVGRPFHLPYQTKLLGSHLNMYDTVRIDANTNGPNAAYYDFNVNLLNAKNDIVLFFNVVFERSIVIRNSLINGEWGQEENDGGFPFEKTVSFFMEIYVDEKHLVISVNGNEFTKFAHRVENPETDYVSIEFTNAFYPAVLEVCQA